MIQLLFKIYTSYLSVTYLYNWTYFYTVNLLSRLPLLALINIQRRPKAPPATQNASQKSLGDKNKEVKGDNIYLFVSRENKCIKPIKQ